MEATKIDHFFDVQRQMHSVVQKRANFERNAGNKLIHVKLKGHEDIANEFKRLARLKMSGTYYAVKEAQMQSLITMDEIQPSKEVQRRIEGTEREIFGLLSAENAKSEVAGVNKLIEINMSNCLKVLKERNDQLKAKLSELCKVETEFGKNDHYTGDGFLKRDVGTRDNLLAEKKQLEEKLSNLEKDVQQSTASLEESNMQLTEAESKVETYKGAVTNKRKEIQKQNYASADARAQSSANRDLRNEALCRVLLQRKALKLESKEDLRVEASHSLHSRREDIEKDLNEKSEKLRMLKLKEAELDAMEKALDESQQTKQAQLEEAKEANSVLDEKVAGIRECNARVARDLETCLEDVTNSMDVNCTVWRDRALKNIFDAGALDVAILKNVAFSNKDKYKFPQEQYQIVQSLKPELGMLQGGVENLQDKIKNLTSEIEGLNNKEKTIAKQRELNHKEFQNTEHVVSRTTGKLARFEQLLKSTTKTTENQLERLAELLPKTNILETMEATKKLNLLGPILERVEGSTEPDDVLKQYHTMRKEILEKPEKYAPAMAFEFLQREMMIQIALEEKLNRQLERL
ncbi:myosin-11-like [Bolinopsis microptera]|uniref:myosin-11-like n=1 Tax=Bolinopsis microptera TaxID=2820187 RepID=UPI00307AC29C